MSRSTDPIRELIAAQKRVIALLREQVEAQSDLIRSHENTNTWRTSVRSGTATIEEFAAAIELEESGEESDLLPRGFLRDPSGRVVRLNDDGTPEPPTDTDPVAALASDITGTFLGGLAGA